MYFVEYLRRKTFCNSRLHEKCIEMKNRAQKKFYQSERDEPDEWSGNKHLSRVHDAPGELATPHCLLSIRASHKCCLIEANAELTDQTGNGNVIL